MDFEKCYTCEFMHCGYNKNCELIKTKKENPYRKLNNYVYKNLEAFGNTVINIDTLNDLGEEIIIKDIKDNGFINVSIEQTKNKSIIIRAEKVTIRN